MRKLTNVIDKIFGIDSRSKKERCIASFKSKIKSKTIPENRETMYIVEAGLFDDLYSMSLNGDRFKENVFDAPAVMVHCSHGIYNNPKFAYLDPACYCRNIKERNVSEHKDCNQSCFCFNLKKYIGLCYYFDVKFRFTIIDSFLLNIYDPLIFHGAIYNKYIDIDTKKRCLNLCKCDYYDKWINAFPTHFPKDIFNIIIELLIFNYYDYPKI
jgi:hypothetical protein